MRRKAEQAPAERGHPSCAIDRAQPQEQHAGGFERGRRRGFEPAEARDVVDAGAVKGQDRLGQVRALDLGNIALRPRLEIEARVKAQDAARPRAPGAAGPLRRGGLAHLGRRESRQPAPGRVPGDARQARVDDGGDAGDRDGALGDVCGQDDLAAPARGGTHRAELLRGREVSV